jgi:hypothetical protein
MIAQVIATIQVYLSNIELYNTLTAVSSAGYLAIPNQRAMGRLRELNAALGGGLFFTFSIGAGISLGAMAAAWLWIRLFQEKRTILVVIGLIWAGLLFWVNSAGFSLMPTLYFLLIAPVVFALTARRDSTPASRSDRIRSLVQLMAVPLLALLWFTQYDKNMFLDLRDHLLLSNNYGRKFSDLYYTYTLYPAEAFKALNQKTIKTGNIDNIQSRSTNQMIGKRLIANDYLPLINAIDADLVIRQTDEKLVFQTNGRQVFQIPLDRFLDDSRDVLRKFSEECDRDAIFRQFTFLSLLIGFPVSIYMLVHAAFYYLGYFIFGRNNSALTASIICLLIGISVLIFFQSNRSRSIQVSNISIALASAQLQTRLAALKLIEQKKLEIANYQTYWITRKNRPPQERYWLVRTLAFSRRPETYKVLLEFLNDDNLNVRTMTLYSFGVRRNPRAIRPILSRIENSDSWYEQMYAYKALRALGWKQTRSH